MRLACRCSVSVGRQGTVILHVVVIHVLSLYLNLLYTKPLLGLKKSYFTVHFVYIVWDVCNRSNRTEFITVKDIYGRTSSQPAFSLVL